MSLDENKSLVLRHFEELWNNGQVDRVEEFCPGLHELWPAVSRCASHR